MLADPTPQVWKSWRMVPTQAADLTQMSSHRATLDFAQRMFSRDMRRMQFNRGLYSLFLSPEGRVWAAFWAFLSEQGLILLSEAGQHLSLKETIEKYHFSEPFELIAGNDWRVTLKSQEGANAKNGEGELTQNQSRFSASLRNVGFEFEKIDGVSENSTLSPAEEKLRIEHGVVFSSRDFDASTLVFDIGFEEFCDENKGCYIGQEVVERVRSRGGVGPKRLLLIEGPKDLIHSPKVSESKVLHSYSTGNASFEVKVLSILPVENRFIALAIGSRKIETNSLLYEDLADRTSEPAKIAKFF